MGTPSYWSEENRLKILVCPISGAKLRRPNVSELRVLEGLRRSSGLPEGAQIFGASEDGSYAYAELGGIALMLPRQAIKLKAVGQDYFDRNAEWKQSVAGFYDTVGWTRDESGEFVDSCRFEDIRSVSRAYMSRIRLRLLEHLPRHGGILLDCASGPIQFDEYLTYGRGFDLRICVDISWEALRLAQRRDQ
jgi:hypothetical protein